MNEQLEYDPRKHTARANALVIIRAQEWGCSPAEALTRIVDEESKKITGKEAA